MADSGANAAGLLLRTGWEGEAERACALCYLVSDFTQHRFPPSCGGPSCPHAWVQSVQVLKIVMPFRLVRHITPLDGGPVLLPVDHHAMPCHVHPWLNADEMSAIRPAAFLQALEEDPECTAALYNLNTALRMVGRHNEAVAFSWRWIQERLAHGHGTTFGGTHGGTHGGATTGSPTPIPTPIPIPNAIREEGVGGAGLFTVVCVRWGDKYGAEYVERLAAGVRRHLTTGHRFVCYTDDVEALRGRDGGVEARPLGTGCGEWRGWWHKAFLFSRLGEVM